MTDEERTLRAIKQLLVGRQRLIEYNYRQARDKAWRRMHNERHARDRLERRLAKTVPGSYAEWRLSQLFK